VGVGVGVGVGCGCRCGRGCGVRVRLGGVITVFTVLLRAQNHVKMLKKGETKTKGW